MNDSTDDFFSRYKKQNSIIRIKSMEIFVEEHQILRSVEL